MKLLTMLIASGMAVALYGCSPSTPGGPGTALPESEKPMIGQTDNTFTLDVPMMATKLEQGVENTVAIGIKRGTNFAQDVSLKFSDVPQGIHIQPSVPVIARTDEEVKFTIHAAEDAPLGDFTVKVSGVPESGPPANAELTLTISKHEMAEPVATENQTTTVEVETTAVDSDAARAEREAEIKVMRAELDALQVKYDNLKERAAKAKDVAKEDLDEKVAAAKIKLDEAEESLKEAKDAAPDRWEKIKEGFKGVGKELKSMFE